MCFVRPSVGTHQIYTHAATHATAAATHATECLRLTNIIQIHAVEQVHALLSTLGGAQKLLNDVATEETFLMQTRSRGLGMTRPTFIPNPKP
jgi:hypothetical protein